MTSDQLCSGSLIEIEIVEGMKQRIAFPKGKSGGLPDTVVFALLSFISFLYRLLPVKRKLSRKEERKVGREEDS